MGSSPQGQAHDPGVPSGLRLVHALPLVPLFMVGLFASGLIIDNSFLWHIRAGTVQHEMGAVLSHDVFSFTELGSPWRTQSWVAELLYGWLESVTPSYLWASWMVLVVSVVIIALVGISMYRPNPSPVVVGFAMIVAVWLIGPFLQPRPVIFSFLLLAALVVVLQHRDRVLWVTVPILWVWAGVHGSWIIGGLLIVLEWLRTSDHRIFRVGLVALAATLATAHGLGTWSVVVDFFGAREALAQMQEWKVPDFGGVAQMPYLLVIAGVIIAAVRGKLTLRDLIVVLPFMFLGMTSRRTVVPAAIVLLPWAARAIPTVTVPRSRTSPAIVGAVMVVLGIVAVVPMLSATTGELDPERFPGRAARDAIAGANAFYDDGVGGFLIFAEWPDRLVWIDDRAELHGAQRFIDYRKAREGDYEAVFAEYGFDAALAKPDWPLTDRLVADGWQVVHTDAEFVVLRP
ncbi:MAG: hypothetical protein R2823_08355 [Acidimicrobiia bacterium]